MVTPQRQNRDDCLADLAVGWRGDQIKISSITEAPQQANRLLERRSETW